VVEAFRICVDKANELGVYNKWSALALQRLQKLRPEQFPPLVERLAEVNFEDRLVVAENGIVIPDGKNWRAADVEVVESATPGQAPVVEPEEGSGTPPEQAKASPSRNKKGKRAGATSRAPANRRK